MKKLIINGQHELTGTIKIGGAKCLKTKKKNTEKSISVVEHIINELSEDAVQISEEEVREYAIKNNIPVAQKQDSQDFYKGDYSELFDMIQFVEQNYREYA